MIIIHLLKETNIMKQFDIHDFLNLFYFKINTNQLNIKFLKNFKINEFYGLMHSIVYVHP
jgi:hypothetical protein